MDTNTSSITQAHIENVHDSHHMFKRSTTHIFPTLAKTVNSMLIKMFWYVAEAHIRNNSISAVGMLPNFMVTSPGSWRFKTVFILFSLNMLYNLNYLISRYEGLCMASIFFVIQLEWSPSIALGNLLLVLKSSCLHSLPPQNWQRKIAFSSKSSTTKRLFGFYTPTPSCTLLFYI